MKKILYSLITLAYLAFSTQISLGATYTVTTLAESGFGSLREILNGPLVADGDIINFSVSGTIVLASPLIINKAITINGPMAGITLSGNNTTNVLEVNLPAGGGDVVINRIFFDKSKPIGGSACIMLTSMDLLGALTLNNCTIANAENITGVAFGGAIYAAANLNLNSCTLSNNISKDGGGAIANLNGDETININACTIVNNSSTTTGGGAFDIFGTIGALTIKNSILALNTNSSGSNNLVFAGTNIMSSGGYNICDDGSTLNHASDLINTNPQILALAYNGGATPTHRLGYASPALNVIPATGSYNGSPANDQRGIARADNYDIGAFEYRSTTWTGSTWTPTAPLDGFDAFVAGNLTLSTGFDCLSLIVEPGIQFTNQAGSTVNVRDELRLKNNGANGPATLVDLGIINSGRATAELYLTGTGNTIASGRNWYVSSPVNGGLSADFKSPIQNKLWFYDEPGQAWTEVSNTTTSIDRLKGYIARRAADGNVILNGTSLNSGSFSLTNISRTGTLNSKRGFALVGNPYPSYLNWESVQASSTNLITTMWYRTKNSLDQYVFDTYNSYDHLGTNNNQSGDVTKYIPPMQAFWVRVNTDGNEGTLSVDNTMRSHQTGKLLKGETTNENKVIRLAAISNKNTDEALICFTASATNEFDLYDSPKMFSDGNKIAELYTTAGKEQVVINGLTDIASNPSIALGFKAPATGQYTIKLNELTGFEPSQAVILVDNLLGVKQDLRINPAYTFSSEIVNSSSRFRLELTSTTGIDDLGELSGTKIYSPDQASIKLELANPIENGKVQVYNQLGQELFTQAINSTSILINQHFQAGVYFVSLRSKDKVFTQKIVLSK
jgi:hypothetical protein